MPGNTGHLIRALGALFGIAAVIGGCIGQGILRAPGVVASGVGQPTLIILLWLVGGFIAAIDSMSTVELATSIRRTGGSYAFVRAAFGQFPGLAAGFGDILGYFGAAAFLAVVLAEYLHRLGVLVNVEIQWIAVATIAVVAAIQLLGTRIAGRSQEWASAFKALVFALLIGALLLGKHPPHAVASAPSAPLTLIGLIIALRAIVGTYLGWNAVAFFIEEVRDVHKTIVRGMFTGIALVTFIYTLVNVALLQVLTPAEMAASSLPAGDAAARVFGPSADVIVTAISLVSVITILNMTFMSIPRALFAIARDAGVPFLSRVAVNGTPVVATLTMAVGSAALAIIGVYAILLTFATWLTTFAAACVNLAAIVLRVKHPALERPWRMPLFPLPAAFALCINCALLAGFLYESPLTAARASLLLAVATGSIYAVTRRGTRILPPSVTGSG